MSLTDNHDDKQVLLLLNNAIQQSQAGETQSAQATYNKLQHCNSENAQVLACLGMLALTLGHATDAIHIFQRILNLHPEQTIHHYSLAIAYYNAGKTEQAEQSLQKLIQLTPDDPAPYARLGLIKYNAGYDKQAVEYLSKAVTLNPNDVTPYFELVIALRNLNQHEQALQLAKRAVQLKPDAANLANLGRTWFELGELAEAEKCFHQAIEANPLYGISYYDLSNLRKYTEADTGFINRTEAALLHNLPALEQSHIHFALGKMHDDLGNWDTAFHHYKLGNTLTKPACEPQEAYRYFKHARKIYSSKRLQALQGHGSDSETPVFVVGMPRSGTTLIEQIIASHPQAAGAGELPTIADIDRQLHPKANLEGQHGDTPLDAGDLLQQADIYMQRLREASTSALRIVDKMPANFLRLGLIHLLFPKARIIHIERDPLDTCLSCYFQAFRHVGMSYDLEWIARYYNFYRKVMDYWQQVLPTSTIRTVSYDDLVRYPADNIPAVIDAAGLPWREDCLAFHNNTRTISTTSIWQARQPIYTSSSKRWHSYAKYLGPLATSIRQHLDEDAVSYLKDAGIKLRKPWKTGLLSRIKPPPISP